MHTKQQIQQLLSSANFSPSQRRGQNFLVDLNLMRLLVNLADIHSNDIVMEVGCGTGSLTEALAEKAARVITVEIDRTLARIAQKQLAQYKNVQIIVRDVLENKNTIDSSVVEALRSAAKEHTGRLMLVSNLPYSVACPVMLNLVMGPVQADCMYVTVQKEVAERMAASPGNKDYGSLSILLAATGQVKIERKLPPSVFWPEPQVDSAIVSFVRQPEKHDRIRDMTVLADVVALFIGHRRKMLRACAKLAEGRLEQIHNWPQIFEKACVEPHSRPEMLTAEQYISVANLCAEQLKTLPGEP
jgi:16S rRNA (adenine1518-N6/adenine1519-N6)-dimethyltransferase